MRTVHLIYPHGPHISCPDAIGRHLAEALRERYDVRLYDWKDTGSIKPVDGDVLLGHPHPSPLTVFRRSARVDGWSRRIAMFPFNHGDLGQIAFADRAVGRCDVILAITGNYWFETAAASPAKSWVPKLRHLDLAVDRAEFPRVKKVFSPQRSRRFVYIGHSGWQKNTAYLSMIAARLPRGKVSWVGAGRPIAGVDSLGVLDFTTSDARDLIASFDFTITVGRADANPATVLESMAWGLIPVCTKESGYRDIAGIINVPLDDASAAAHVMRELDEAPEALLHEHRRSNDRALDTHFTWERFTRDVVSAIESPDSPPLKPRTIGEAVRWRTAAVTSRYAPWRPGNLLRYAGTAVQRSRAR